MCSENESVYQILLTGSYYSAIVGQPQRMLSMIVHVSAHRVMCMHMQPSCTPESVTQSVAEGLSLQCQLNSFRTWQVFFSLPSLGIYTHVWSLVCNVYNLLWCKPDKADLCNFKCILHMNVAGTHTQIQYSTCHHCVCTF